MDHEKHIALVCNPTRENERALRMTESISLLLKGIGIRHSLYTAVWPQHWDYITEVWVVGGDGTLNWFINLYPDIRLPLAVFPAGSGNDFHWMLYGDKSVEEQVDRLLNAQPIRVDAGDCNGRLFLNGIGIGFDGAIVKDLIGKKKLAGKASYLLSILKHIISYQEKPCTIILPEESITQDNFMISIANSMRYGGSFLVAPKASLTDGLLDINIVGEISPMSRVRYMPVIEKGEHLGLPFIQYRQASRVTLKSPVKLHAHVDGEYMHTDYFNIEILPKRFSFLY